MRKSYASTIDTTKLTSVLSIVASAAGVPFTGESYYDFRFPNATHILYVAEDGVNGDDFTITLPSSYGYFERGWGVHNSYFTVDGTDVRYDPTRWFWDNMWYGTLTAAQLLPATPHVITASSYGVLMITYQELP